MISPPVSTRMLSQVRVAAADEAERVPLDANPPPVARKISHTTVQLHRLPNPFDSEQRFHFSALDKLKMLLVGLTLFPLRLAVILAVLPLGILFPWMAQLGADPTKPHGLGRRLLITPIRLVARSILWGLGYWWIPVTRAPNPGGGTARVLVVAPHYSFLDAFLLTYLELPAPVSKADVAKLPVIGAAARALQTIFVDRKDAASKAAAGQALRDRAKAPGWPPLLIFPEGTVTNGRALISFKPGAFAIGEPVQPIVLQYGRKPVDVNGNGPGGGYTALLLAMFQLSNSLRVTYLPPAAPTEAEASDAKLFAAAVRERMAAHIGVPVTGHSYDDAFLAHAALKFGVSADFEMSEVKSLFNLGLVEIKELLRRFHDLDTDGSGEIEMAEFERALGLQAPCTRRVAAVHPPCTRRVAAVRAPLATRPKLPTLPRAGPAGRSQGVLAPPLSLHPTHPTPSHPIPPHPTPSGRTQGVRAAPLPLLRLG